MSKQLSDQNRPGGRIARSSNKTQVNDWFSRDSTGFGSLSRRERAGVRGRAERNFRHARPLIRPAGHLLPRGEGSTTGSTTPRRYWSDMKRKLAAEAGSAQTYEKIARLKSQTADGNNGLGAFWASIWRLADQGIPNRHCNSLSKGRGQIATPLRVEMEKRVKLMAGLAQTEEPMTKFLAEFGHGL